MLARGDTVRQCAGALGLAPSTIDNHKSRLMKKLGIHKASELTCRAVRDGLIVPLEAAKSGPFSAPWTPQQFPRRQATIVERTCGRLTASLSAFAQPCES